MPTRRDVLGTLPLISLAPTVPGFLARSARSAEASPDGRVLVVIQLDGGNDGINTVVPYKDEGYARHRKTLRLADSAVLKFAEGAALHPAMTGAAGLIESGRLAIVPGVGYPNPDRSHFRSLAIWQTARLDSEDHPGPGWIGRGLDAGPRAAEPSTIHVGSGAAPAALRGRKVSTATVERLDDYLLGPDALRADPIGSARGDDLADFVRRSALDARATADRMAALGKDDASARYPDSSLANRLRLIARLLKGGLPARVYYVSQPGYDTHAAQLGDHFGRLSEFSGALTAFLDDLAASNLLDRVLVVAFSEFGRRVAENGSGGTDHGTAGPVFLAGSGVRPGLAAPLPSLTDLVDGDLKVSVDFRSIYATILDDWLGLPASAALGGAFPKLPILA